MNEWEARYKALAAQLSESDVFAAEQIVEVGLRMAASHRQPLHEVLYGLVYVARRCKALSENALDSMPIQAD